MQAIPEDVKADVEEAYATLRQNDGRIRVQFDTKDEALLFCRQAASYASQREAGVLKFRKSPTKGLPDTVVDFRVTADLPANGAANAAKGETPK